MALEVSLMNSKDIEDWTTSNCNSLCLNAFWSARLSSRSIELLMEQQRKGLMDPTVRYLKVTIAETGEIIASAKWGLHLNGDESTLDEAHTVSMLIPEERTAIMEDLLKLVYKHRKAYIGTRPHLALTNLTTRPAHRRKGAARLLIQWGLDVADKLGVEVYTESHEGSKMLYEKFGFRLVGEFVLDLRQYGGVGVKHYYVRKFCLFSSHLICFIQGLDCPFRRMPCIFI